MADSKKKPIPAAGLPAAVLGAPSAAELMKDIATLTVEDLVVIYAYADAIVETVREPLIILGENLAIRTANKAFFDTFKVTKEETYEKKIFDLGNGQWDIPKLKELLLDILPRDTQFHDFEITHIFEDVGEKTMLLNARRIVLEKYKTELILLAIEDITERKAAETLKDDFIGVASHELRTPLGTIKALAQTMQLEAREENHDKKLTTLTVLEKQVDRLTELIDSFTDLYRLQTGKLELKRSEFDLNLAIDEVMEMFTHINKTHTITKEGAAKRAVNADKGRIEQVLINLLTNAVKYSPKSDKIIISIKEDPNMTIVGVQDFGIGIPKEKLGSVRERFFRVSDEHTSGIAGLGLGLHISSEIIKDHGGEMSIESTLGKGSKFSFTIPVVE